MGLAALGEIFLARHLRIAILVVTIEALLLAGALARLGYLGRKRIVLRCSSAAGGAANGRAAVPGWSTA